MEPSHAYEVQPRAPEGIAVVMSAGQLCLAGHNHGADGLLRLYGCDACTAIRRGEADQIATLRVSQLAKEVAEALNGFRKQIDGLPKVVDHQLDVLCGQIAAVDSRFSEVGKRGGGR